MGNVWRFLGWSLKLLMKLAFTVAALVVIVVGVLLAVRLNLIKLNGMYAIGAWILGWGALGGLVGVLMSEEGLLMPRMSTQVEITDSTGATQQITVGVWRPGFVGHMIIGAFAAIVLYGLYGPLKDTVLLGTAPSGQPAPTLIFADLVGAFVSGLGGAKLLAAVVERKVLATATAVASTPSVQIASAQPLFSSDSGSSEVNGAEPATGAQQLQQPVGNQAQDQSGSSEVNGAEPATGAQQAQQPVGNQAQGQS